MARSIDELFDVLLAADEGKAMTPTAAYAAGLITRAEFIALDRFQVAPLRTRKRRTVDTSPEAVARMRAKLTEAGERLRAMREASGGDS